MNENEIALRKRAHLQLYISLTSSCEYPKQIKFFLCDNSIAAEKLFAISLFTRGNIIRMVNFWSSLVAWILNYFPKTSNLNYRCAWIDLPLTNFNSKPSLLCFTGCEIL